MKPYPIHPLAELLPRMTDAEFTALEADAVAKKRIIKPGILLDGKVLDGRHRQEIAVKHKLPMEWQKYQKAWGDPAEYVYSNALGRNLTGSQKAASGALFLDKLPKRLVCVNQKQVDAQVAKMIKAAGDDAGGKISTEHAEARAKSRDVVGDLFGVSGRHIQTARVVLKHDRKLFDQVFNGGISLPAANAEVRRSVKRAVMAHATKDAPHVGEWEIANLDCLIGLPTRARKTARLIFADPQYNIDYDYGTGKRTDKLTPDEYLTFCGTWIKECIDLLTLDGSLWILISDEFAAEICVLLKAWSPSITLRAWIKWYETFGCARKDNFTRSSRHLFYCVRDPANFVWNREAFSRISDRAAKYDDARAANGGQKIMDDVWGIERRDQHGKIIVPGIPRLVENSKQRMPDFKTQLPEELIRPIILGCSDPGDLVIDPFVGSGTTPTVAVCNGRKFYGTEVNPKFAKLAEQRVRHACASAAPAGKGKTK